MGFQPTRSVGGQRTFDALYYDSEVMFGHWQNIADVPHVKVQVGDISEIQDQVPARMRMPLSGDGFSLTSRPNKYIEWCAGYPGY